MLDKDPAAVTEAASAEICYARYNHRILTRDSDFRPGSKGRKYCEDLQELIRMVMNGSYPSEPRPDFIEAVTPLIKTLLRKWHIGELDKHFKIT